MLRHLLVLLLALSLALGGVAAVAAAGCAASAAAGEACGTCDDGDGKGQTQQGCAALACSAGCIPGPAAAAEPATSAWNPSAIEKAASAFSDAVLLRAIPPDLPPPR